MNVRGILLCFFHVHRPEYKPRGGVSLYLGSEMVAHLRGEDHAKTEFSGFSEQKVQYPIGRVRISSACTQYLRLIDYDE